MWVAYSKKISWGPLPVMENELRKVALFFEKSRFFFIFALYLRQRKVSCKRQNYCKYTRPRYVSTGQIWLLLLRSLKFYANAKLSSRVFHIITLCGISTCLISYIKIKALGECYHLELPMTINCRQAPQFRISLLFNFIKSAWSPLVKMALIPKGGPSTFEKIKS